MSNAVKFCQQFDSDNNKIFYYFDDGEKHVYVDFLKTYDLCHAETCEKTFHDIFDNAEDQTYEQMLKMSRKQYDEMSKWFAEHWGIFNGRSNPVLDYKKSYMFFSDLQKKRLIELGFKIDFDARGIPFYSLVLDDIKIVIKSTGSDAFLCSGLVEYEQFVTVAFCDNKIRKSWMFDSLDAVINKIEEIVNGQL